MAGPSPIASPEQKVAELRADINMNRERFVLLNVTEA